MHNGKDCVGMPAHQLLICHFSDYMPPSISDRETLVSTVQKENTGVYSTDTLIKEKRNCTHILLQRSPLHEEETVSTSCFRLFQ